MYTVVRITGDDPSVHEAANAINQQAGGTLSVRARGDGYGADISKAVDWNGHATEIQRFVTDHADHLRTASARGASIQFDTMIDRNDLESMTSYSSFLCSTDLLTAVASVGAELVFSWYRVDQAP